MTSMGKSSVLDWTSSIWPAVRPRFRLETMDFLEFSYVVISFSMVFSRSRAQGRGPRLTQAPGGRGADLPELFR